MVVGAYQTESGVMRPEWVIYYGDGSSFSSEDGGIWDAPRMDAQVLVQKNEDVGYDFLNTVGDYFVYDGDRNGWRMVDLVGLVVYLQTVSIPCVVFGLNMSDENFRALRARVEKECGPKSGWLPRETKRK